MDIVRNHEIEDLLRHFAVIEAAIGTTRKQLKTMLSKKGIDDAITAAVLAAREPSETKRSFISDKTGETAYKYRTSIRMEKAELRRDLLLLEAVKEKLGIGMNSLSPLQSKIIELRFSKMKSWIDISDELCWCAKTCQRKKQIAIERLRRIARISVEDYQILMKLIDYERVM